VISPEGGAVSPSGSPGVQGPGRPRKGVRIGDSGGQASRCRGVSSHAPNRTREPTRERNSGHHPTPQATAVDPQSAGRGSGRGGRFLVLANFPGRAAFLVTDGDAGHGLPIATEQFETHRYPRNEATLPLCIEEHLKGLAYVLVPLIVGPGTRPSRIYATPQSPPTVASDAGGRRPLFQFSVPMRAIPGARRSTERRSSTSTA
jgi:hypothetical protein